MKVSKSYIMQTGYFSNNYFSFRESQRNVAHGLFDVFHIYKCFTFMMSQGK